MTWNWLKDLAAKAITIGIMAVAAAVVQGSPVDKGLGAVFAYAVWTQIIVPKVKAQLDPYGTTAIGGESKSRFALI